MVWARCAVATGRPLPSKSMQRVLVVPWSIAATNLADIAQASFRISSRAGVAWAASPFAAGTAEEVASDSS
jgi:hypothetical protein